MKPCLNSWLLVFVLTTALSAAPTSRLGGQTLTVLHSFSGSDGANPWAGLILSSGRLYGTTFAGGGFGSGTVFAINTNGTGFTNLHNFNGNEGTGAFASLIVSGNTLYGTLWSGGVFKINMDGTGFTTLPVGVPPQGALILSGNTLYGTGNEGGSAGWGSVFAVNRDGTGLTNLHNFAGPGSDGGEPVAGLILSDQTLFGTTTDFSVGCGTVFAVNIDGTGFTNLHSFVCTDGAAPYASLILSGTTLYGTTMGDFGAYYGTVFRVNMDGTGFTNLHTFAQPVDSQSYYSYTNSGGAAPYGGLILMGNRLYGTTTIGGSSGNGTVFVLKIDGTGFRMIHDFSNSDGAKPYGTLILSGNTLYGTTQKGGGFGPRHGVQSFHPTGT
jgi:uncharacterized repeat protein (TIGR03803 family)